jgi:hypothetical protein
LVTIGAITMRFRAVTEAKVTGEKSGFTNVLTIFYLPMEIPNFK